MDRTGTIILAVFAALLVGLAPIGLVIWISYKQTVQSAELELRGIAESIALDTNEILGMVDQQLKKLEDLGYECDADTVQRLRRAAFDVPEISELGLVTASGRLACTSWGAVEPDTLVDVPPAQPGLRLRGPILIPAMPRRALVVARTRADGGEVHALIQRRVMIGRLRADLGRNGFAALLRSTDLHVFVSVGYMPEIARAETQEDLSSDASLFRGRFDDGVPRTSVAVRLADYPDFAAVAAVSQDWITQGWARRSRIPGFAGIAAAVSLIALVLGITRRRLSLTGELQRALRNNEFEVRYQPVVDLAERRCIGSEALIRWRHPQKGLMRPATFIAVAEETGLIEPMTRWLLGQVGREIGDILAANREFHVAINLSSGHFQDARTLQLSERSLLQHGVSPEQVIYEITERGLIREDTGTARHIMTTLRAQGHCLALDDFGTGYSSLSYLDSFPFDYLKIDQQFTAAIGSQSVLASLVDSIIQMAADLRLRVIAEGVQSSEQADYLAVRGVALAQGDHFSPPLNREELLRYLETN